MARKCESWLTDYLKYTENQESPDIFHFWVGVSTIAAILERSVYIERGYYRLYPNLYIILVGGSAVSRKTTSIDMGTRLAYHALDADPDIPNLPLISQKTTTEALIAALIEEYKARGVGAGYMISDELAVLLGKSKEDATFVELLTGLYKCSDHFDYRTLARGKEECRNVCLNLLGGTTPEWLKSALPEHAIAGGFAGRILFVFQPPTVKSEAWPQITQYELELMERLQHDLRCIARLEGEYKPTPEAKEWYRAWYEDVFRRDLGELSLSGYFARKHDTLLKVSMVLAASQRDELIITTEDMSMALDFLNENEKDLPHVMQIIQADTFGERSMLILRVLEQHGPQSYQELLSAVHSQVGGVKGFNEALQSLIMSGHVKREQGPPPHNATILRAIGRRQ